MKGSPRADGSSNLTRMARRLLIYGNSGSGKSFLARRLAEELRLPCLDLDTIVWEPGKPAVARPVQDVHADLDAFCARESWIAEGCYGNLVELVLARRPELIFLNPGEAVCLANCRARPWEPHKYASKDEQDARLDFLLTWVSEYYSRDDDMSLSAHRRIFDGYDGPKREVAG
jgi:adenylate kinase family enzyme